MMIDRTRAIRCAEIVFFALFRPRVWVSYVDCYALRYVPYLLVALLAVLSGVTNAVDYQAIAVPSLLPFAAIVALYALGVAVVFFVMACALTLSVRYLLHRRSYSFLVLMLSTSCLPYFLVNLSSVLLSVCLTDRLLSVAFLAVFNILAMSWQSVLLIGGLSEYASISYARSTLVLALSSLFFVVALIVLGGLCSLAMAFV
jgi:hypothetical protein